jgi:hypothetical protein
LTFEFLVAICTFWDFLSRHFKISVIRCFDRESPINTFVIPFSGQQMFDGKTESLISSSILLVPFLGPVIILLFFFLLSLALLAKAFHPYTNITSYIYNRELPFNFSRIRSRTIAEKRHQLRIEYRRTSREKRNHYIGERCPSRKRLATFASIGTWVAKFIIVCLSITCDRCWQINKFSLFLAPWSTGAPHLQVPIYSLHTNIYRWLSKKAFAHFSPLNFPIIPGCLSSNMYKMLILAQAPPIGPSLAHVI